MTRYINADKLIADGWRLERHSPNGKILSVMSIADVPTVDVEEVKHGYIIEHKGHEDDYYCECSVCKTHEVFLGDKYCSECGAKMDGGNVNE